MSRVVVVDAEVVVVGGGVMGLATAGSLARAGADVILLERFEIGHDRGSSHAPTRIFRFLYHDPLYVRMAQASLPLWRGLEEASGHDLLRMTGGIQVDSPRQLNQHRQAMETCGASVEMLDADERRARASWLDVGDAPAMWAPDLGVLAAETTVAVMRTLAERAGAVVRETSAVTTMDADDDGVTIRTAADEIRARRCVVAAGAWTADLLGPVGLSIPLSVTREQVLYFDGDTTGMVPFVHGLGHWVYAIPAEGQPGAFKIAEHRTGAATSGDARTFDLDAAGEQRLRDYVRRFLPTIDPEPVGFTTCLYTNTPDTDFVLDRRGPVVVVSACSGHGFKFAPLIGEIAAALALDQEPPMHIERFALDRF
jgi:sarcosine oxidase